MKKLFVMALILCGAFFFAGCGSSADENKTPEQIKEEVASMSAEDIQAVIAEYQAAIEEKTAELAAEAEKLKDIPLTEMLGDDAKNIKASMEDITKSIDKLKDNMAAYAEGLKNK